MVNGDMASNETTNYIDTPLSDISSNTTTTDSTPVNNDHITILAVLPVLLPIVAIVIVFILARVIMRRLARKEAFERALLDPSKRLENLEVLVGHEKFVNWRLRKRGEMKNPTTFPTEYICAICLAPMTDTDVIRGLPCDHCFHQDCLDDWFRRQHNTCPLCKRNFFTTVPGSQRSSFQRSRDGQRSSWVPGPVV